MSEKGGKVKNVILAAGVVAVVLFGQHAMAKSLEEVLKEKGVITEEDYRQVTQEQPVVTPPKAGATEYRLGDGFTFTSPDEKFKGSIGACLQLRYTYTDLDDANGSKQDSSEFRLRRIKLYFNGYAYSKDLTYKLLTNLGETTTGKFLEETYMNYRFLDEAQLRFGQDKVPFARQELTSTAALQFVDRSIVTDAFKPSYDMGLMFNGRVANGLVIYNVGVYGGDGQNTPRSTNDNAFAVRIAVNPFGEMKYSEADVDQSEKPLLGIGANYYRNTLAKTAAATFETNLLPLADTKKGWLGLGAATFNATEKVDINTAGFDAAFKWQGLSVQGEYFLGQADGKDSNKTLRAQGFYAQGGYFIIPTHMELAGRYSYLDPNRDASGDHQIESQGAVSYYFNKHNLKLQADYTNSHKQNGAKSSTDDKIVRLQAQLLF